MEKYRVVFNEITKHKVARETKDSVWFILNETEKQERKESSYYSWHDTFEEAKNHIMAKIQSEIDSLLRQINYQEGELRKIHKLEKF